MQRRCATITIMTGMKIQSSTYFLHSENMHTIVLLSSKTLPFYTHSHATHSKGHTFTLTHTLSHTQTQTHTNTPLSWSCRSLSPSSWCAARWRGMRAFSSGVLWLLYMRPKHSAANNREGSGSVYFLSVMLVAADPTLSTSTYTHRCNK